MKIRQGFVSNSSSSSFVILKSHLSEVQRDKLFDYYTIAEEYNKNNPGDARFEYLDWGWGLKEIDDFIFGETSMDNFDMDSFFNYIGVDTNKVFWDEGWNHEPYTNQLRLLDEDRIKLRKLKLDRLDDLEEL